MFNAPCPLSRNTVRNLTEKIRNDYDDVVAVFLFGSFAEGTWTSSSDLDVEVVLSSAEGLRGMLENLGWKISGRG